MEDVSQCSGDTELQRQFAALEERVATNRTDIDSLLSQANEARFRADAHEERSDGDRLRIDDLEARADLDHALIIELQAEGLVRNDQVVQLELALRTSRQIGAAIGIQGAEPGQPERQHQAPHGRRTRRVHRRGQQPARRVAGPDALMGYAAWWPRGIPHLSATRGAWS